MASASGRQEDRNHPSYVEIPDPRRTEGLRAYSEPADPHPLQLVFLEESGARDYVERLRALLVAGEFDAADRLLAADLAGFDGKIARLCRALPPEAVALDGWDDLLPILAEFEGPPISAITIGLTNEPDLVFAGGEMHEPTVLLGLFSDEAFAFGSASREALLDECAAEAPGWAGQEEDVEFYVESRGLAELNTALIQNKHRYFLRDGRDGVSGRAPGGHVEYVLGCWVRATRFLQAVARAAADGGLPDGVRLIAGTVDINADLATLVEPPRRVTLDRAATPAPVASLTIKKWVPREEPADDVPTSGASLRQRLDQTPPVAAPAPIRAVATAPVVTEPAPRRGFLARLFGR